MEHVKWLFFIILAAVAAAAILLCGVWYANWNGEPRTEVTVEIIEPEPAQENSPAVAAPVKSEAAEPNQPAGEASQDLPAGEAK